MKKLLKYIFVFLFSFLIFITCNETNYFYDDVQEKYETISKELVEENVNLVSNLQTKFNNLDIIGTIKIDGTDIDTVLVKTDNNDYYLNHSYDKTYNSMGAIFLDYRNKLTDKKLLIYGHNFKDKEGGFHQLTKYLQKSFYDSYPYIELTINNIQSRYIIFSMMIEKSEIYPHTIVNFSSEESWMKHILWMKSRSVIDTGLDVNSDDYIITLQTCYYNPEGSYLIINAKKV